MATKTFAMLLMVLCTALTSFAQVFYKKGITSFSLDPIVWIPIIMLLIGLSMYAIGAVIMIIAFKHGEVTVLYPIITLSYVWVSFLSIYFFNEVMNIYKWLGVLIIVVGIVFIGIGGKKSSSLKYAGAIE